MFTLKDSMFISADTLIALQILHSQSLPNPQMQGADKGSHAGGEPLSVYGLFHPLAATPQGRLRLRQVFLRPSNNLDVIRERQRTIKVFRHPENSESIQHISRLLKKIKNIRTALLQLHKGLDLPPGRANVKKGVWATLQRFAAYSIEVREAVPQLHGSEHVQVTSQVS